LYLSPNELASWAARLAAERRPRQFPALNDRFDNLARTGDR
jgi:hypothetical protein